MDLWSLIIRRGIGRNSTYDHLRGRAVSICDPILCVQAHFSVAKLVIDIPGHFKPEGESAILHRSLSAKQTVLLVGKTYRDAGGVVTQGTNGLHFIEDRYI